MASIYKCSFISQKYFTIRSKLSSRLLMYTRQFCSKENETKNSKVNSEDMSVKESEKKLEDDPLEKSKLLSQRNEQSSDDQKVAAKQKLMSLLSEIEVSSDSPTKSSSNFKLAKPLKRPSKKQRLEEMQAKEITPEKEMNMAIKAVASNFKEDQEKVEAELREKLSALNITKDTAVEGIGKSDSKDLKSSEIDNELNQKLMSSVEEVATTLSEKPIPPRSELAQRLLRLSLDKKISPETAKSMRSTIGDMKLEQKPPFPKKEMQKRKKPAVTSVVDRKVNLFGSPPLSIFALDTEIKTDSSNKLWKKLEEKQLHLLTQFAPANAFEEMIMWTEQGKHWKFPIDNETEMGAEENVGFHEHVFLEHHLKGFPTKGPIRHFMELVVVGLSKNPYITVERKVESIEWFRSYFKENEEVLKQTGAIE